MEASAQLHVVLGFWEEPLTVIISGFARDRQGGGGGMCASSSCLHGSFAAACLRTSAPHLTCSFPAVHPVDPEQWLQDPDIFNPRPQIKHPKPKPQNAQEATTSQPSHAWGRPLPWVFWITRVQGIGICDYFTVWGLG